MLRKSQLNPISPSFTRRFTLAWLDDAPLVYSLIFVLLVALIGVALALQGWQSRAPAFDLLTYIHNVRNLLATGAIPLHGDTGSYGSLKPPGTTWLMAPSALLFADPRLSEYTGTALLHFATLLGIFLLARLHFGTRTAYLAVLLYGLSSHGIFLAGSLWPNGRPDFFIWLVLLTNLWALRRDSRYLAAAVLVWGTGMYVDMAHAPAFFIWPAVWLFYRPPVRLRDLTVAVTLLLVIWSPYLWLESTRGFADVRSQLLLRSMFPADYKASWCDASLTLTTWEDPAGPPIASPASPAMETTRPTLLGSLQTQARTFGQKLLSNFAWVAPVTGASQFLLLGTISSLLLLSAASLPRARDAAPRRYGRRHGLTLLALGMLSLAALANEFVLARLLSPDGILEMATIGRIQRMQASLTLVALGLLAGTWLTVWLSRRVRLNDANGPPPAQTPMISLLALCLVVPWLILILVAEPGKPERFWWLWPLQVMFLAAGATYLLPRLGAPRLAVWAGQLSLIIILVGNPFLLSRAEAWAKTGWAGADADQIRVVDYVAQQLAAEGRSEAMIGYHAFIYEFMAAYNITNPVYKVGAELDLLFQYRHGVSNTNQCAEGLSPQDEYRIVQVTPEADKDAPRQYFAVPLDGSYRLLQQFGAYQVYRRG